MIWAGTDEGTKFPSFAPATERVAAIICKHLPVLTHPVVWLVMYLETQKVESFSRDEGTKSQCQDFWAQRNHSCSSMFYADTDSPSNLEGIVNNYRGYIDIYMGWYSCRWSDTSE